MHNTVIIKTGIYIIYYFAFSVCPSLSSLSTNWSLDLHTSAVNFGFIQPLL